MNITQSEQGGKIVANVTGRLDAVTSSDFEKQSDEWASTEGGDVVLDFEGLEYISSAGLRSILTLAKKLKGNQRNIALCRLNGIVEEVFVMSGFTAMFPVFKTVDEAVAG
ncbi:STAS domain-containing protein [Pseudodesulfovibrio sp. zrk46]|uniref:STAS domain-containing protein n=1 Tax=Pseudodesulfovibrio sp. zrk46 TaxID=2725288 RepID=UPI001448E119|nr:STAS domain-containing protein [Pseudodesulfovibrio sp. zrk46]QJB56701.1 STAS domain-containing protein [Pseudodesulfovibrio sp. zrk46]